MAHVRFFEQITFHDHAWCGSKAASLAHMHNLLSDICSVPGGYIVSVDAYRYILAHNNLIPLIESRLAHLEQDNSMLYSIAQELQNALLNACIPSDLVQEISDAYTTLSQQYNTDNCDVAVRSSALAEDLPGISAAGLQESFLNVVGITCIIKAYQSCIASLFSARAISYRLHHRISHDQIGIAVIIQKMIRADRGISGVMFTCDPETGFADTVIISSSYGLCEPIVQGAIIPDEYAVIKSKLHNQYVPLVKKKLGTKTHKMVYADNSTCTCETSAAEQCAFSLSDRQALALARIGCAVETAYPALYGMHCPLDIEWAADETGAIFLVQVRPLVCHAHVQSTTICTYEFTEKPSHVLAHGIRIGNALVHGSCFLAKTVEDTHTLPEDAILVVPYTSPDWVPAMRRVRGIITERGGRTCHAAIVARELGIPALVGSEQCIEKMVHGQKITMDCSSGSFGAVYSGHVPYIKKKQDSVQTKSLACRISAIIADPDKAWEMAQLPFQGVGLLRLEFLMAHVIGIHPQTIADYHLLDDALRHSILQRIAPYTCPREFFVTELARGIACIATACGKNHVIVRMSDFKSNEYHHLLGGPKYEQYEENPMLGLRGAARYLHPKFSESFLLECKALIYARDVFGADNIDIMIPFVRSPDEMKKVREKLEEQGVIGSSVKTKLWMMVEVPTNVILLEHYAHYVDGFSIGSNDLTQLVLGIDRDSSFLSSHLNETNEAVMAFIQQAIEKSKRLGKPIGICGQAPADFPHFAKKLIAWGIDSIAIQPSSLHDFLTHMS